MQLVQPSFAHFWRHRSDRERVDARGDRHAPFGDIAPERLDLRLRVRELGGTHDCAMRSSSPLIRVSTGTIRLISEPLPRECTLISGRTVYGTEALGVTHRPLVRRGSRGQSRTSSSSSSGLEGSDKRGRGAMAAPTAFEAGL